MIGKTKMMVENSLKWNASIWKKAKIGKYNLYGLLSSEHMGCMTLSIISQLWRLGAKTISQRNDNRQIW